MGTWGHNNFDGDTQADHLSTLVGNLIKEIEEAMASPAELEPDEYWGCAVPCNLELLTVIGRNKYAGFHLPKPHVIESWKQTYMEIWEENIDESGPKADYKTKRRQVLNKTFDELISLSSEINSQ